MDLNLRDLSDEFSDISTGWTARFELYDTKSLKSGFRKDWHFNLETDEIMHQIRNCSRYVNPRPSESNKTSNQRDLAVHFPVSIGNNLDVFTVLRRVYIRRHFEEASSCKSSGFADSWTVLPIPIERHAFLGFFDESFTPNDRGLAAQTNASISKPGHAEIDHRSTFRFDVHNDYLLCYAIRGTSIRRPSPSSGASGYPRALGKCEECHQFDRLKKTLFSEMFVDDVCITKKWRLLCNGCIHPNARYLEVGNDAHTTLTPGDEGYYRGDIETTNDLHPTSAPDDGSDYCDDDGNELDETSNSEHSDDVPETECTAHSIAVFSLAGARNGEELRLLDFIPRMGEDHYIGKCTFHPVLPLMAIHCVSEDEGSVELWNFRSSECVGNIPRSYTLFGNNVYWTESLDFSPCGKRVIVEEYSTRQPTVIPINESILYKSAQHLQDVPTATNFTTSITDVSEIASLDGTAALSQNQTSLLDSRSSIRLDFHPNRVQTDIEFVWTNGNIEISQPLLTLPNRPDTRHISVSLLSPRDRDATKIRILISKSPKLFCTLTDAEKDASTLILEKEIRALPPGRKRNWDTEHSDPLEMVAPILPYDLMTSQLPDTIQGGGKRLRLSESGGNHV